MFMWSENTGIFRHACNINKGGKWIILIGYACFFEIINEKIWITYIFKSYMNF